MSRTPLSAPKPAESEMQLQKLEMVNLEYVNGVFVFWFQGGWEGGLGGGLGRGVGEGVAAGLGRAWSSILQKT